MAQDRIRINGEDIYQPDEGLSYSFETTSTEDSGRAITGVAHVTPLFTIEQLGYQATNIPAAEASRIVQHIVHGRPFTLHYFSVYYGAWRDGSFRVDKSDYRIGRLTDGDEYLSSLSFNMTGVNPI